MCKTWGRIRIRIWAHQNGKSDLDRVINMTPIHSTDCGSISHQNSAEYRYRSIPFQMKQQNLDSIGSVESDPNSYIGSEEKEGL
jgi:hypothetical protein